MVKTSAPPKKKAAYTTTVFIKRLMAWSGIVFIVYLVLHAYGNTHYFDGEMAYDHYAVWLRTLLEPLMPYGGVLWILRAVLLACLLAHAGSAFHLWYRNRKARGNDKYEVKKPGADYFASRYAMRTMRWGGVILLLFIIWHILQFTTLTLTPGGEYVHGRAYANMYYGFQLWWVYLIYLVALAALCLHVWHGVWSALQTLGATRGNTVPLIRLIAFVVAFGLFAVFMSVPTAILFGWVDAPMAAADYYPQFCDAIGSASEQFAHCAAH
ncbi:MULTISPECIES: succinate dehydrogenase cytochrome b subunit [unclassified Actinomyces]|uniref:succinate dehydrogenase cytochrome b subunit n=1 Tax=unclassified Actinomyces TaxID=2609248 RepID=UPI0013742AC3|nr:MULTISPECIES: succinate dehydrogenase cytochrome b subunit [unclassified Actinomyces]MBW3069078.1 succinate dehydrogenase cytochrome b subunit [Actinomyces sp. 594]NDR54230.1 succinate dehydrogenase cytochrome b subunit [Actinomyces sp. 565]QHO91599.1 cytochrome B [Actinomyces sp. 432]